MLSRSLVLGYHGCDLATAQGLVYGYIPPNPSENKNDWLGGGFYCWEDSPSRAMRWAKDQKKQQPNKIATPAVLGVVIDLGNCLNLIDAEHLELVSAAHQVYLEICGASGVEPIKNKGDNLYSRNLDYAVFETLHKIRQADGKQEFDSVRAFFVEGRELYPTAGLRSLDHIQICVRNPRIIVGFFLPRAGLNYAA